MSDVNKIGSDNLPHWSKQFERLKKNWRVFLEIALVFTAAWFWYKSKLYKDQLWKALFENHKFENKLRIYWKIWPTKESCLEDLLEMKIHTMSVDDLKRNPLEYQKMCDFLVKQINKEKTYLLNLKNNPVDENWMMGAWYLGDLKYVVYKDENWSVWVEFFDHYGSYTTTSGWKIQIGEDKLILQTPCWDDFGIE